MQSRRANLQLRLPSKHPEITVEDGYAIAMAVRDLKLAAGRSVKGHKIGLTSKAMRDMTGATEPDYGFIYDDWFVLEGDTVQRSKMNRPLVEVELAFVMKHTLTGPFGQRSRCDSCHGLYIASVGNCRFQI